MKTKKLTLLLTAAMFLMGGQNAVKADTTLLSASDGWQKITSISQSDIDKYYYVFVDKDNDLMLGLANGVKNTKRKAMFYQKGVNVVNDQSKLWAIEKNGENYALRNASVDNYLQMQTEWGDNNPAWDTNDQPNACEWTGVKLEYADNAWSIISTKYYRALGVYGDSESAPADNVEIGANSIEKGQKFLIYAIPRSTYYAKLTEGASKETPKDLSWAIKNNTLDDNQFNRGWNLTCNGTHNFNNTYEVGEFWSPVNQPNFEMSQTLTGLQPGTYLLSALLFENGKTDVYLFGNTKKVCVEETDFSEGTGSTDMEKVANLMKNKDNYGKVTVPVLVGEDGVLTLGLCGNCPATTWVVFDNFQLQYIGKIRKEYVTYYQEVQNKAKELLKNQLYAQVQGKDKVDLETLANEDANAVITVANYEAKKTAIETAMTTFQEDKEVYNTFVSHVENANLFGKDVLGLNEIPSVDKASDKNVTGADLRDLRNQMYLAQYEYVKKTYTSDITSLMGIDGWKGWEKPDLAADNWQSYAGDHKDPKYYEVKDAFLNTAKWEQNLSRSIQLYPGKYVVKLACRTSYNGGASSGYVSVKVGDSESKAVNFPLKNDTGYGITTSGEASFDSNKEYNRVDRQGGGWEWRYVPFELSSALDVTLTIHVASEGGQNYPGFYEPQLLAMPEKVTLKDAETYNEAPALVANVTLDRKLGEKWNTIVLPFALNETQVKEMFGEGAKVAAYKGSTVNGDHVTLNFEEQTSMVANIPYMIKPGSNASKKVNGVVLESASELKKVEDANNEITFVGNYTSGQTLLQNSFFISNNMFYRASGQEKMKAYRATFQVPSTMATAKTMNTVFVGEGGSVTAIDDVQVSPQGSFDVYHINGMLVKKNAIDLNGLDKGIYIINGKKYVVK